MRFLLMRQDFDDEEMMWPTIDPDWTKDDLLQQNGMFRFARIKETLGLKSIDLTRLRKELDDDQKAYQVYGFYKPFSGQYIVRMSRFRTAYKNYFSEKRVGRKRSEVIHSLPAGIDANKLKDLNGVYLFSLLEDIPPFGEHLEAIKKLASKRSSAEEARLRMGVWREPSRKYLMELPTFWHWFRQAMAPPPPGQNAAIPGGEEDIAANKN
jgi:hypothetical protein